MFKKIIAAIPIILFSFSILRADIDDIDEEEIPKIEVEYRRVEKVVFYIRRYELDTFDFETKQNIKTQEADTKIFFLKTGQNGTEFVAHLEYSPTFSPYPHGKFWRCTWKDYIKLFDVDADEYIIIETNDTEDNILDYYYKEGLIKSFYWD